MKTFIALAIVAAAFSTTACSTTAPRIDPVQAFCDQALANQVKFWADTKVPVTEAGKTNFRWMCVELNKPTGGSDN